MAIDPEDTPFLADNEHIESYDERESHSLNILPANAHFKLPLRMLAIFSIILSLIVLGLLITSYAIVESGPFGVGIWSTKDAIRCLALFLLINIIVSVPPIFLPIPILITMFLNLTILLGIFLFTGEVLGDGWPNSGFCPSGEWDYTPDKGQNWTPHPVNPDCVKRRTDVRIMLGACSGVSILIGLLLVTKFLLRLIAVARTRFWEEKQFPKLGNDKGWSPGWNPKGFTVQFTLSVLPHEIPTVALIRTTPAITQITVPISELAPTEEASEGQLIDITA